MKKGWSKPAKDSLKLNVDGALFPNRMIVGVGRVLRDEQEKVLMAATKLEIMVGDPLEFELLAILRGLQICLPLGLRNLEVESDSLLAVKALHDGDESIASYSHLLRVVFPILVE